MAILNIHKQAILKLINSFTTSKPFSVLKSQQQTQCQEPMVSNLITFQEPQTSIDLSTLTRLGYIISMFEQYFRPNSLIINGDVNSKMNNQNVIYLKQITVLIEYMENNNLLKVKMENSLEATIQLQSSHNVQMLIFLIRDWMLQFYLDKNFIHELFPSTITNEGTTFSLVNLKENNIFLISLLIFNIFYKLRNSFTEYNLLLEFSWLCFTDLEPYIGLANLDTAYIYNMLQSSLLSARIEEEQESQINASLHKQIEILNIKILETQKRMLSLDMSKQQMPNLVSANKPQMKIMHHNDSSSASKSSQPIRIIQTTASNHHHNHRQAASSSSSSSSSMIQPSKVFQQSEHHSRIVGSKSTIASNDIKRTERPYKCEVCLKTFPTSYKLNRHSYSHSGERPYMCSWQNCDKRFNDNYHLRRHMNTHTGEKPYQCKYPGCPKRYSRSEDLRNHQKTHVGSNNTNNTNNSTTTVTATPSNMSIANNQQPQSLGLNLVGQQQPQTQQQSTILQSPNGQTNIVLVQQPQQTIIPPQSPVAAAVSSVKSPVSHHHQQQQQLLQNQLNQLQQQMQQQQQQNYPSNVPQNLQEAMILQTPTANSSANNQSTSNTSNNPTQQQPQTAQLQQHLNENYY